MAGQTRIMGQKARRGERMTMGSGWRLAKETGRKRVFAGTLLTTFNLGVRRIAIFSVPK
jgi:hypothetical protein